MKRVFSLLLIAFLLVFPMFSVQAENGQYVFADDDIISSADLQSVNMRAAEIAQNRGVGVYYFYFSAVEDLPTYADQFAKEHVIEENALVLGFNANYRHFLKIGPVAEAAFPDSVCDGPILDAYRAVKGDPKGKLLAYLNAADDVLETYLETNPDSSAATDTPDATAEIALTDGGKPTVVDRAHLLTASEAESLSNRLKEIGSKYRCDVVIATVPSLDGKSAEAYADDFFDYNGYGYGAVPNAQGTTINGDGILLLLSMEDRDFAISTSGYGIKAFTDYGIQTCLEPAFLPYLKNNSYFDGFDAFADECESLLKTAQEGVPYDCRHIYIDTWTDAQLLEYNDRAAAVSSEYHFGVYFLKSDAITDAEAYLRDFADGRVSEPNAILVVSCPTGYQMRIFGSNTNEKFTEKKYAELRDAVIPSLERGDTDTAVKNYLSGCEKILNWRPVNWLTFGIAIAAGLLIGWIPVSSMKHQMTSVSKQTSADAYIAPSSFTMLQSDNVLLGKNVTRSVHVVQNESSGGGRSSGFGGGFHGGSSTHSSSSGGTHGGHSGKF